MHVWDARLGLFPYEFFACTIAKHTEENGHELDQRAIRVWKYLRTGINAYLKNQVENHSKIDNYVNNQKSKISESNCSKAWREKRDNMLSRETSRAK